VASLYPFHFLGTVSGVFYARVQKPDKSLTRASGPTSTVLSPIAMAMKGQEGHASFVRSICFPSDRVAG